MNATNRDRALRLLAAGALMLVAGSALAFSSGPPNGHTNAPGEANCTACHGSFPLNSGSGMLSLDGLPDSYTPGDTYDLSLTLDDPDASRWGFELTILDGGEAGTPSAGTLVVTDSGTTLSSSGNRSYLKQNSAGTSPGTTGSKTWSFQWTAPAEGTGDVVLYVAGNGANNNGGTSGDRIYATSFASTESTGVPVLDTPLALVLHGAAPNPFNPATAIRFELPRADHVRVSVFTVDGRRVTTLADRGFAAGSHAVSWRGEDHSGRAMGSGTYVYVVEAGAERRSGTMTLVK
jgi:hypothetical protein